MSVTKAPAGRWEGRRGNLVATAPYLHHDLPLQCGWPGWGGDVLAVTSRIATCCPPAPPPHRGLAGACTHFPAHTRPVSFPGVLGGSCSRRPRPPPGPFLLGLLHLEAAGRRVTGWIHIVGPVLLCLEAAAAQPRGPWTAAEARPSTHRPARAGSSPSGLQALPLCSPALQTRPRERPRSLPGGLASAENQRKTLWETL